MTRDAIVIDGLEISARIGVPEAERAAGPQRLTATLLLHPRRGFSELEDRIENAVDYAAVCVAVKTLAASGERHLLETLAEEITAMLLRDFPLAAVEIEVRKFILPDTNFVAARIRREAESAR